MKHRVIFELIQDLFVSIVLTGVGAFLSGASMPVIAFLLEVLFAWVINLIIGFVVPEKKIGESLCKAVHAPEKAGFWIVMAVIVIINVIGISLCVVLKNVGFHAAFWSAWGSMLLPLLIVGYIAACVFFPVSNKLTALICHENKSEN